MRADDQDDAEHERSNMNDAAGCVNVACDESSSDSD